LDIERRVKLLAPALPETPYTENAVLNKFAIEKWSQLPTMTRRLIWNLMAAQDRGAL
jgi:hypothetical protein